MSSVGEVLQQALQYHQSGQLQQAEALYRQVLAQVPEQPDALHLLGTLVFQAGDKPQAETLIRKAIELRPDIADYYTNLALILVAAGNNQEAIEAYRTAIRIKPDSTKAYVNLGVLLSQQGEHQAAIENYCEGLKINPNVPEIYNNLGDVQALLGNYDAAYQNYNKAIELAPGFVKAHSNLLFLLSQHLMRSPQETLLAHQQWDKVHAAPAGERYAHDQQGAPDKRLRIAYVSPDLRHHSVGFFFEPLLAGHDRSQVEVYCYAEVHKPDDISKRMQSLSDAWCSTIGMSDAQLAEKIHEDDIDILVDLAGHTADNRLKAFTYKPAPVQATYLGYFATTGLSAMDYWITDNILTPEDTIEQSSETIYRLARCCLSYQPPAEIPDVHARVAGDEIVFGSFNDLSKISPQTLTLWGEVLNAVPGSRLLIKAKSLKDNIIKTAFIDQLNENGISAERVTLMAQTASVQEHLLLYGEIDIALDTVPRTGGTTTMEALWMGVPVITLAGERFIERLSASLLTAAGLTDCIAASEPGYIATAVALAGDYQRRATLRFGLRDRLKVSPLCDGAGLAREMEAAYRDMWQAYLSGNKL